MAKQQTERVSLKYIIIPYLIKGLMLLITMTCRVRWHDKQRLDQLTTSDAPFILSFWHNCSTFAPWAMRDRGINCMVSASKDGEYVARLGALFGNRTVRGSTSKGSSTATRKILKLLRKGEAIALTPDGPRGPKYQVQTGVLFLAAAGKAPIVPMHIEASRQWQLNSWDGHLFPKPFSTIHIGIGELVRLDREMLEQNNGAAMHKVQQSMMDNVRRLQVLAGQPPEAVPS